MTWPMRSLRSATELGPRGDRDDAVDQRLCVRPERIVRRRLRSARAVKRIDVTARIGALAQRGLSAAEIAAKLKLTRDEVMGYANRYDIHLRRRDHQKPASIHAAFASGPSATRKGKCQYPIGEPGKSGFHYCGKPLDSSGRPYCAAHHAVCYLPPKKLGAWA
jgi:hypothetical protein